MDTGQLTALLLTGAHVLVVLAAAVTISLHKKPSSAVAWILAIIFIPVIGIIAFFLVGFGRLPRRRREIQREVNEFMLARGGVVDHRVAHLEPEWLTTATTLNETLGALPMVRDNAAQLIEDYETSFAAMVADVDSARSYVHVEFYILVKDPTTTPFFDALARAVARGVKVRVLSDFLSCHTLPNRKETEAAFKEMGAQWHPMLPLRPLRGQWQRPDMRNHRKIVVIDGLIGYAGSQNMIDSSYLKPANIRRGLHWHELMMRVEGPVVGELDAVFATDWFSETDEQFPLLASARPGSGTANAVLAAEPASVIDAQVVPSGASFENDNNLKLFVLLINNARTRVSITSPYFVPDDATLLAITTAAARGLEVELFVSEVADQFLVYHAQRSYYAALLEAGVAIYLYRSPTVLHSKHFTIDSEVAVIGSSNMDIRSFSLNMEVSVLVRGREFVDRMKVVEDNYRALSVRLDREEWAARPLRSKVFDGLARLTSSLQ